VEKIDAFFLLRFDRVLDITLSSTAVETKKDPAEKQNSELQKSLQPTTTSDRNKNKKGDQPK
jgi:hypothetical protein